MDMPDLVPLKKTHDHNRKGPKSVKTQYKELGPDVPTKEFVINALSE